MNDPGSASATFQSLPDLAGRLLGAGVVAANDEFFAEKENLVNPGAPAFQPYTFTHKGQLYDGWETRRRREPGSAEDRDWAIVRLGVPGLVRGVVVDTTYFTGNYPQYCSVEACAASGYPSPDELAREQWVELVPKSALHGDTANPFPVDCGTRFTHVRLSIYPDGGVARLRVHGEAVPDPRYLAGMPLDLASVEHGGGVTACSDMFYSSPGNLIAPGLARVMGEGWETSRRRGPGNDWVTVRLAAAGRIRQVELDTSHFKGNAPGSAALHGYDASGDMFELLPATRLQPDTMHRFRAGCHDTATHIRLDVYPDGGMARLRLYGELTPAGRDELALRWFNTLTDGRAYEVLREAGGDESLVSARPIRDAARLPPQLR